ncbi:MAG: DUF2608 domain-containing protein [Chlamydiae bacterium]|nr:DUF2608 domain-containing protein [Chlamydiota bacterium]
MILKVSIFGTITTILSFEEARDQLDSLDQECLAVFDVDEVLITSNDLLLRPIGENFLIKKGWGNLQTHDIPYITSIALSSTKYFLVDHAAPIIIEELQKKGIATLALTAAATGKLGVIPSMEEWRIKQLKELNIDFSVLFPNKDFEFKNLSQKDKAPPLFKKGILFLGDFQENDAKGILLKAFFEKVDFLPKKVLFFDDKMQNLLAVQKVLENLQIEFQGFLFNSVENFPEVLDEEIAELQYRTATEEKKWISDTEAKELLRDRKRIN